MDVTNNNQLTTTQPSSIPEAPIWSDEKIAKAIKYKKSGEIRPCLNNILLLLRHSEKYHKMFCKDNFSQRNIITRLPPWPEPRPFTPREMTKKDVTYLISSLENDGLFISRPNLIQCLAIVCEENAIGIPVPEANRRSLDHLRPALQAYLEANPYANAAEMQRHLGIPDKRGSTLYRGKLCALLRSMGYDNIQVHNKRIPVPRVWTMHGEHPLKTIDAEFTET